MSQQLVLRREQTEEGLVSVLKALEVARGPGSEPVLTARRRFPAQPAEFAEFPEDLHPRLRDVLTARGFLRLYSHQRAAYDSARAGRHTVVVTPTASGKTLCYNVPVLDTILKEPDARALYLFPTKALAQDQLAELHSVVEALGADIGTFTYDGDTPGDARKAIRSRAHVVVTNPDMLHKGILPHHTKWVKLFENLRYVVVDELHHHRGVYGSHVANIFRRLQRLCRFYGSDPLFLCSSATIGNPKELAETLTGKPMAVVDRSGAPRGERYFAIYNPPVVNRQLGIDIGGLDAAVLLGYPGSVASTWQQAGRAGRRSSTSVAVLVANSTPLNQFIARHPDYFFDAPVEEGRINPDNLHILVSHVKCAAFELPFGADEVFGSENVQEVLGFLEEDRLVHRAGGRWHWTSESYPADAVSLRSVSSDNFVVQDITRDPRIIAEVDFDSAPSMLHEKAVYILEGKTYFVEKYDHAERRAHVREAEVDYYTQAVTGSKVKVLERFDGEDGGRARRSHGEVHVTSQVVGFKKIKFHTSENVGSGELQMPENEMHTTAYWLTVPRDVIAGLPFGGEERRDGVVALSYTLGQLAALFLMCDRHDLGVAVGDNGQGEARVERAFNRRREAPATDRGGSGGAGEPLPLDRGAGFTPAPRETPNIFIYDNYPGGIGLSEPLFRLHSRLLTESRALIAACPCSDGCPSCVGPAGEAGTRGKEVALALLDAVLGR